MKNAYNIIEQVEYISKLYLLAKSSSLAKQLLDDTEIELILKKFQTYVQAK